ncbi:hypothetical protein AURDEDRAFT_113193 [Auricularia subglabra TFB-10046 SS5]|nr:hypothetical protein AURDEDRAFT_113193 [Auricularia subglabra TFB-10046 SS5]
MPQYLTVPAYERPAASSIPDDTAVQPLPLSQVDYLSHVWKEEDVWRSWRNMTRQKNAIANGTRLENASWRTWWKQRNKLKTISPETLNWLKDSDVTWLYGPLHSAQIEAVPPPKVSTTEERLGLLQGSNQRLKPILKHRSIFEMLTNHMPVSPMNDGYIEFDGGGASDGYFPPQPVPTASRANIPRTTSDTNLQSSIRPRRVSPRHDQPTEHQPRRMQRASPPARSHSSESPHHGHSDHENGKPRHISFNTFVEQCIAIEKPIDAPSDEETSDEDEEDESDDGVLEFRTRSGSVPAPTPKKPSLVRHHSHSGDRGHVTIAPIAPTILKTSESFPGVSPAVVFVPPEGSLYGSTTPPVQFQLDEEVPFQSARTRQAPRPAPAASSVPHAQVSYGAGSEMEDYLTAADLDTDATPDLGFGDQFKSGPASPRGRRDGPAAARYGPSSTAANGQFHSGGGRRHHRSSPSQSPEPSSRFAPRSAPIDIVNNSRVLSSSPDTLSPDAYQPRGRSLSSSASGSPNEESRGRSYARGSSSSGLSDRSRSGSRHRVGSSSPIGSISPNPSRTGSVLGNGAYTARGADLVAAAGNVTRSVRFGSSNSNSPSPPSSQSPPGGAPAKAQAQQTLKQALQAKAKEPTFVRPSLVINRDELAASAASHPSSGEPSSPGEAEARKRDDYWPDATAAHATKAPAPESHSASSPVGFNQDDNGLVGRAVSSARGMIRGIFNGGRE